MLTFFLQVACTLQDPAFDFYTLHEAQITDFDFCVISMFNLVNNANSKKAELDCCWRMESITVREV